MQSKEKQDGERTLVIIPAAGDATRLRPITSRTSKSMVPVGGRPCIDWIMDRFNDPDRFEVIIITHPDLTDLDDYIAKNSARFMHVKTVSQHNYFDKPGPVDAIKTAMETVNRAHESERDTIVWLGDTILHPRFYWNARHDWEKCESYPGDAAVRFFTGEVDDSSQWCVYDEANGHVIDKPEHVVENPRALIGVYEWRWLKDLDEAIDWVGSTNPEISDLILYTHEKRSHNGMYFADVTDYWLDIGQLHTYYETNARLMETKSRAFNEISVDTFLGSITKRSTDPNVLEPEREWYSRLTRDQQRFVPRIWRNEPGVLEMDLESGVLLSDVLVWDRLPESTWRWIIGKIVSVMDQMFWSQGEVIDPVPMESMWISKSVGRLDKCEQQGIFNEQESDELSDIAGRMVTIAGDHSIRSKRYIHGDLHSGNILFDFNTGHAKFIDPRGEWPGIPVRTTAGDWLYDWAKLAHDFYWGYSALVSDRELNIPAQRAFEQVMQDWFKDDPSTVTMIKQGGLLLLATCIPLHYDNPERQKRMTEAVKRALHHKRLK